MNSGKTVFSQLMDFIPKTYFDKLVLSYKGNYRARSFSCWDQFLCLSFAQLTYRESLRDIEACLRSNSEKLFHMGIKGNISRTNLARANETRDWRIFENFTHHLIGQALKLFNKDELIYKELDNALYALDATTIDLCLTLFPWAQFRKHKSAIKLHTLLDLRTSLPRFINVTSGSVHDVKSLELLTFEPMAIYVMDKAYTDFKRLNNLSQHKAFFITRAKNNLTFRRIYSNDGEQNDNIICDQTIKLIGPLTSTLYPDKLRRIKFFDKENDRTFIFITNNFSLPSLTIALLYKERWKIELFFKWIKQHLRIKSFYGTSINAIRIQIWTAISIYVLIIIIKEKLSIQQDLYIILQILSVNIFNKILLKELFKKSNNLISADPSDKQLLLFNF
jgi:hypothetical protein